MNKISFKSFPMRELIQKNAEAQKQNKGVEIQMVWKDRSPYSNVKVEGDSCIVTETGEPWSGTEHKINGKTCHYHVVKGFSPNTNEKTCHVLLVNDKDVCMSHDINNIRDLPKISP